MKTNQNPQDNQDKNQTNQTNQPNQTPGAGIQDPAKRPLDPTRRDEPVKEPNKQQPLVDPDPTSPEKYRNDPYAGDKGRTQKTENDADIDENDSDVDTNPTGKTKDTSVNVNDPSHKENQPNVDRNTNSGDIDRENPTR